MTHLSKNFTRYYQKAIRLHDLRHSVASNLLNSDFTVVQVAEWLGHSSSTTTLNYYAHVDKTSKINISKSIENTFKNAI